MGRSGVQIYMVVRLAGGGSWGSTPATTPVPVRGTNRNCKRLLRTRCCTRYHTWDACAIIMNADAVGSCAGCCIVAQRWPRGADVTSTIRRVQVDLAQPV